MNAKIIASIVILLVVIVGAIVFLRGGRHSDILVKNQTDEIVACALQLYAREKAKGSIFDSQCLGRCSDYAIDVVHVPRNEDDNKVENQCLDFRDGRVTHFLEIDMNGNIVRKV